MIGFSGFSSKTNDLMELTGDGKLGLGIVIPSNRLTVNGGKFRYIDGTQNSGYVLVGDANGVAKWDRVSSRNSSVNLPNSYIGINVPNTIGSAYLQLVQALHFQLESGL